MTYPQKQKWDVNGFVVEVVDYDKGTGWIVPEVNWHMVLADIIDTAVDGDTVLCCTESMVELGQGAHSRMCPQKKLMFVVWRPDTVTET
jgi:hypothetical protein